MTLQMITGRAQADKSAYILNEIKHQLTEDPLGPPIFYIVPEQMTFQLETELLQNEGIEGSIRAQVVSFSRLAFRVLQEMGGSTKQFISSTGMQMMLRKIIEQRTESFHTFQRAVEKTGFIQELEGVMTEFKRHRITPDLLEEHIQYAENDVTLKNKLMDLHYIYAQLEFVMASQYIDGEDQLRMLADWIPKSDLFENAIIYIDGFYRFTPNELHIIEALLKKTEQVSIVATTDENEVMKQPGALDLFFQTTEMYHTIRELARQINVPIEQTIALTNKSKTRNAVLAHLEAQFDTRPSPVYRGDWQAEIGLYEAIHPRAEIEGMLQEILGLTRENNYRYNDMVIYVRDIATYHDMIQTIFRDYDIPVFIDEKRTMLNHPLVEFIRSFLDVMESNWRYDALFRLLKSGFQLPSKAPYMLSPDNIDRLENYVLEYGIRQKHQWTKDEPWKYQRFRGFDEAKQTDKELEIEKEMNAFREQIVDTLLPFTKAMKEAETVQERVKVLYELLEHVHIPKQLEAKMTAFEADGEVEKAREEEQVWNGVIQIIDEMVEMIGEERLSLLSFQEIMETGLESLQFSHVPPTLDHVIVASIDQSRIRKKKVAFLLGVNEGSWPMKPAVDGMINENEREFLKQFGLRLAESNRRVLLDDSFYMYLAFTTASEKLWVSYPISDKEGHAKSSSPMILRLQELFPQLSIPILLQDPDDMQAADRFITTASQSRAPLTAQLARYMRGYGMDQVWWNVLDWYMENENVPSTTQNVLSSLYYENKPVYLHEETVKQLYPEQIKMSVSRLEMLHACSYQHFARYNLQLERRRTYALEAPDIGQLFHEALKTITEWLQAEGKDFAKLTKEDSQAYAQKSMDSLAPVLQHRILSSTNRYQYIQRKLQQVIAQATFILSEQARASGFSPAGIELSFGMGEQLPPVTIPLENGYEVVLRGRIDRVDQAKIGQQLYLRIIDYKSSSRGLELVEVYYGLALQMLTYLNVIISQAENWLGEKAEPAGVLYFHVHDPLIQEAFDLSANEIDEKLKKEFKMKGLLVDKPAVAEFMDTSVSSGYSDIAPFGLKKDGSFYSNSHIASEHTFDVLEKYMYHLMKQAGIQLTSGEILLNPFEHKKQTACTFCDFRSVCQFDQNIAGNTFRKLAPLKNEEIFSKIEEEIEKNEGGDQ